VWESLERRLTVDRSFKELSVAAKSGKKVPIAVISGKRELILAARHNQI